MPSPEAAVAALVEWRDSHQKGEPFLEPNGWVRASAPMRRVCPDCGTTYLDAEGMCPRCLQNRRKQ